MVASMELTLAEVKGRTMAGPLVDSMVDSMDLPSADLLAESMVVEKV